MYSVATAELPGSPVETWGKDGSFRATVVRVCPWASRNTLAAEIYGEVYPRITGTMARATNITIQPYPDNPDIRGLIGDLQHADYDLAKLTIEYETTGPDVKDGDWFTESIEPTVEFVTLDPADFRWSESQLELSDNEAPGMQVRGLEYKLTRYKLSAVPMAVKSLVGCVNNAQVSCRRLGLTFSAEELLYHPPVIETKAKMNGSYEMTLAMRFTYKPGGWNTFWSRRSQRWERLQVRADGGSWVNYYQYPLGDFSPLFG